jgi:predicted nucleic acid-binding Zn ribbon protein
VEDLPGILLKILKSKQGKEKYILFSLKEKWKEIVGEAAANHTQPSKLTDHVLLIHTDNAAWSHNLLMLKKQLIAEINQYIPLEEGKKRVYKIQELRFYQGKIQEIELPAKNKEDFIPKLDENRHCPQCGVPLMPGETICSTCARKEQEKKRQQIHKMLCEAPWFSYKDCVKYLKCDRIVFNDVKSSMQERAKEKALDKAASTEEKFFAVMLNFDMKPEDVTEEFLAKTLKSWKRRKEHVFASGE